jgi:acetyl esterase/lipase
MKQLHFAIMGLLLLAGCGRNEKEPAPTSPKKTSKPVSLAEARQGFQTKLRGRAPEKEAVPDPPPQVFQKVYYNSPAGKLAAYVTPNPKDGARRPAIIWITGGDCNSIGEVWEAAPVSNDQTASAFRKAGLVMMFPSLRGGNDNPGVREGFLGEVEDVLAAEQFLRTLEFVNPERIYLGGHSTGGTLVLLVAECSGRFRAVFSFGPVEDVAGYGSEYLPFQTTKRELELRSPVRWLHSISSPVFVFEGARPPGNLDSLRALQRASRNPMVHFLPVNGADHFSILSPTTALIASKIPADEGPVSQLAFTTAELRNPFSR